MQNQCNQINSSWHCINMLHFIVVCSFLSFLLLFQRKSPVFCFPFQNLQRLANQFDKQMEINRFYSFRGVTEERIKKLPAHRGKQKYIAGGRFGHVFLVQTRFLLDKWYPLAVMRWGLRFYCGQQKKKTSWQQKNGKEKRRKANNTGTSQERFFSETQRWTHTHNGQ